MATRLGALIVLLGVGACGPAARPSATSAGIELLTPVDLLPNDLDFIVRIDSKRVRSDPALDGAARQLAKRGAGMLASVSPSLEESRAIFVGGRLMSDGFHGDGVVAIEQGTDGEVSLPVDPSFRRLSGAPSHVELFERTTDARDEAALEVIVERRGLLLATAAEADAVLRIVRSGRDVDRLDPPARGLASFAGRVRGEIELPRSVGSLARAAHGLTGYSGSLEGGDAIHVDGDLVYASSDRAEQAATAARSALGRLALAPEPLGSLPDSVNLAVQGDTLRIHAIVSFAVVALLH